MYKFLWNPFLIYKLVLLAFTLFSLFIAISIERLGYEGLLDYLCPKLVSPYKEMWSLDIYQTQFFHPDRMTGLRVSAWLVFSVLVIFTFYFFCYTPVSLLNSWRSDAISLLRQYKAGWRGLAGWQKGLLIAIVCCTVIPKFYFLWIGPENADARGSWKAFVSHGFWVITTYYYPFVNNHIFYNLFCWLCALFLPPHSYWVMHLPSIVFGLAMLGFVYLETHRKFGFVVALLLIAMAGNFYESSRYMVQGRGHLLTALFALMGTYAFLTRMLSDRRRMDYLIFIVAGILGTYTVPTHLFHLAGLLGYGLVWRLIKKEYTLIRPLVESGLWIASGVVLCYLPVLSVMGWDSFFFYSPIQPKSLSSFWHIFPAFWAEFTEYTLGIYLLFRRAYLWILPLTMGLIWTYLKRQGLYRRWLEVVLSLLLVLLGYVLLSRVFPQYRTGTYYIWHLYAGVAMLIETVLIKWKAGKWGIGITAVLLMGLGLGLYLRNEVLRTFNPCHTDITYESICIDTWQ
jgi:hypothetical protein